MARRKHAFRRSLSRRDEQRRRQPRFDGVGLTGPTFTTSTACSSSNHAIGQAFWLIRQGTLDAAVTGGSEAPLAYGNLKAWESMRVVSADTCRPFSKDRSGMILGEGGAMFVSKTLNLRRHAGRKYTPRSPVSVCRPTRHHLTMPLATGAARAMRSALSDAGLSGTDRLY